MAKRKADQEPAGDRFEVHIGGDVSGQVAIGRGISQQQVTAALTPEFVESMRDALAGLKARVDEEAPPELASEAKAQLDAIETAVSSGEDAKELPGRLERARNWFIEHLPTMAGAVTSAVVHPIVGRLTETLGEVASRALGRRLGLPE